MCENANATSGGGSLEFDGDEFVVESSTDALCNAVRGRVRSKPMVVNRRCCGLHRLAEFAGERETRVSAFLKQGADERIHRPFFKFVLGAVIEYR